MRLFHGDNLKMRIIAGSVLVVFLSTSFLSLFAFPRQVSAQEFDPTDLLGGSVPVEPTGGKVDQLGEVAKVGELVLVRKTEWDKIIQAAMIAAMNSAFRAMSAKLINIMEGKLGVKNTLYYLDALVESKYLVDSLKKDNKAGGISSTSKGFIVALADDFEGLGLNSSVISPSQAALIATQFMGDSRISQAEKDRRIGQLIVGATSLFTSSVACGGVNRRAVENTARFLATASAGLRPIDADPRNPNFYRDMARFGDPYSLPAYWTLAFKDYANQTEVRARQAAAAELLSPGLKTTQVVSGFGITGIDRSLNLLSIGEQNAHTSLFNIAIKGTDSVYNTSSFKAFILSILADKLFGPGGILSNRIYRGLRGIFGDIFGAIFGTNGQKVEQWTNAASSIAFLVARSVTLFYAQKLYDKVAEILFSGKILGESYTCRTYPSIGKFNASDYKYDKANAPYNERDAPGFGGSSVQGAIQTQATDLTLPETQDHIPLPVTPPAVPFNVRE